MKLCFPAGVGQHTDSVGRTWTADKYGMCDVPNLDGLVKSEFFAAGFRMPSTLTVYLEELKIMQCASGDGPFFVLELDKPVWRNSNNSFWVDAMGSPVGLV